MSNGQIAADFHLTFPNEKVREDFEIAFQAFIKDFQKQQTIYYGLRGIAGGQPSGGEGGGQGGGGHVFGTPGGGQGGGQGQGQGLFRLRSGSTSLYVNFF